MKELGSASYAFALSSPEAFSLERIPKLLEQLQQEQELHGDLLVLRPVTDSKRALGSKEESLSDLKPLRSVE